MAYGYMGSFSAKGEGEPQTAAKASLEWTYIQAASSSSDKLSAAQHRGHGKPVTTRAGVVVG